MQNDNKVYSTYLSGTMEYATIKQACDWRKELRNILSDCEIHFYDPCDNTDALAPKENHAVQDELRKLRREGNIIELSRRMTAIVQYDLQCVRKSDFLIYVHEPHVCTCGSWDEVFLAQDLNIPIFAHCKDGINGMPLWWFGRIPTYKFSDSLIGLSELVREFVGGGSRAETDLD